MGQALKRAPRQVVGSKGGSKKQKQPSIASNSVPSIATVRMVYLWSWGPIVGPVNDLRSVKLDGTPVMAGDGTLNYPGVKWQFRSGELNQERMTGISESSNEIAVGQQLLSTTPYVHSITNSMLDAVRLRFSWPQLQSQDSGGNIDGVRIEYAVDVSTDNGPYQQVLVSEVNRKNVTKYERSHRIDLPAGTRWAIRARRITPEANSSLVQDGMYVEAIAEVVDSDQEYPLTAVSCLEYDAEQFGGDIAKIAVLMRGRIVRVPMNYDPVSRTYATSGAGTTNGVWDGTFKEAYTNNPAWVFYDLALHPYYGLGDRIDATMINRWSLYRIGQYCDQLVPDGKGGQEPRFTCNLYLQKQAEAWAVLQDLAAIFHGLAFWDGSQITVNADMPQDPVYNYTLSQILDDGAVKYTGSKLRDRHSQAMVSFDDPDRGYDTDKEPVFDESAIAEYGVREISVEAVGCTSRGQAQRAGQWALMTEQLQLRGASFRVGLDGYIPKPGKVITLSDPMLAGRANGGRIAAVAGRVVTVDRDIDVPSGARMLVNLPSGKSEARQVRSVAGRKITVMADFSEAPQAECAWVLDFDDLKLMQFYVRNITRPEWHQFQLECIQYEPSKFDAIDYGTVIDDRPISVLPPGVQDAPARVLINSHSAVDQGIAVTTMTISWDAAPGAVAYDVEWRWGSRDWVKVPRTGELAADVRGVYAGQYLARVRAVSAMDVSSIPTTSVLTNVSGKTTLPPAVTFLAAESLIFGIGIKWGFPAGAEDTQRTELWYSEGTDLSLASKLADLAYPQNEYVMQGLRAGQRFYFWARLVDRSGNIGPFYPVEGNYVTGAASADAGPILEQIAGEILESHLGQQLTEKIDLIDGNGPGSVNERVGSAKTELAQQISEVNNALATAKGNLEQQITATNQNVADAKSALEQQIAVVDGEVDAAKADLQQKIDSVSVLAGSLPYNKDKTYTTNQGVLGADGKLYQALKAVPKNTPPPNATYWTDVGQAIVTAAGTASRVSKVETDVFTLDGKSTAQASQIGGLQSGLTATNQNVTAAQQAADAANTLAGGKGKVIIQAAAPAVADRLAQNLWIDTTGNANTPKRWNGTTWVAVTDKAASDAASAAQSALSQVALKADATVVNNVATRVSEAEGKLSSQATRMDGMQTSIDGKASSQALQQVTSRVTGTEQKDAEQDQKLTSQSQALVSLSDSVSKKAEAATVQALSNEVNQHGQDLSAQGQSLTKINAALPLVGGENLVYNPSFERQTDNNGTAQYWWYDSSSNVGSRAPSLVPSTLAAGVAQRLDVTGIPTNGWARVYLRASLKAIKVRAGAVYTASVYMRGTAGLRILAQVYSRNAAGVNGVSWAGARIDAAETWQRVSVTFTATTETFDVWPAAVVYGGDGVTAGFVEVDQYQLEEGAQASGWRDNGQVEASNQAATAAAVDAMSAKVIQHGADLASVSSKTTSLENSLTTTNGNVTTAQQAAQAAADAAGAKGKVLYQSTAPAVADRLAQNLWIDTTGNANTPKRWNGTAWTAVTDKVATDAAAAAQSALSQVALKADASALQTLGSTVSQQGQQITADGQSITRIDTSLSQLKGDVAANASATAGLSGRVTANENALTSVSGQVVQLSNSLGDVGAENLVFNPSFEKQDAGTPGMADGWWHDASGTSVTHTPSLVSSTLASGFAQRLEVAGLTPSTWARVYQRSTRRFKVAPGKTYTASVYLRGTAGLRILPQVYGVNEAGSSSGSWAGSRVDAGEAWTRLSVTFTPDANTSVVYPAFVVYAGASAAAGFIEGDQYQLEEGAVATGWRDNGQVNSANQAATATAVEALNSKVTQQGADLASTSSKTTSLENSLSTTNGNVTAAQTAAQNAAALAGSKGKVIVQAAAPDVADRVAQNLWIDTTGNANTPKRWTGTTWQAVTDKVATDAAAAAQSALSQVALKADASALQTMGSTVSQQGQQLIADGQAITGINASLTQVKADVAANASATSGLSGRVTASENNLASLSGQVVQLNNSLGDVGGENLVYNSSFEEADPGTPGVGNGWWYDGSAGTRVPSLVPSTVAPGNAQRLDVTGLSPSAWARVYVKQSMRFKVTPGQTYTASVYVRGTPGLRVLVAVYNLNAAGSNTASWASVRQDATLDWVRLVVTFVASSDTVLLYPSVVVYGGASVTGGFIEADQYQVERGAVATGWRDNGQVSAGKLAANASATEALSSKVTQQGADLASTSSKTTSLENSLSTTNGNVTAAQTAAQNAAALAGSKGKVIVQAAAPDVADRVAQNLWIDTTGNANTPKRWSGTTWQAVTDKAATDAAAAAQSALSQVALKADASALQTMGTIVAQQGAELVNQAALTTQLKASMAQQSDNLILRGTFEDGLVQPWTASPVVVAVSAHASAGKAIAFYGNSFCGLERNVLTKGGEQFDLSADIFAGYMTSGQIARMQMQFFDKAGAAISYLDAFAVVSGLGSFKAYAGRITAPAGAVSARFVTRLEPSDGSGRALWCNIVARRVSEAEAATANAVSSVTSTVNQQGEKLTAETQRIDVLSASVGSAQAAIQNEITARTNADSALSQQIQTTQSTLGDTTASVQRVSTTLNQLNGVANASEVVKVQITANRIRHVAGFGLSIDNSKGAVQSTFAILADRFAILNPSGDAVSSPFAVVGNQTFISDAYIRDASIGNAKITNGAITTAKIGEAEVDTLRIRGNAVTIPVGAFASASSVSVTVTLDGNYPVFLLGSLTQTYYSDISMTRNGVALWVERPQGSSIASRGVMDYPGPGTHTYTLSSNHAGNTNGASILAVVCKR